MSSTPPKPSVLLVDDHPALLKQATHLLRNEFEIIATLPDGAGLAEAVARQQPDAVILDITRSG